MIKRAFKWVVLPLVLVGAAMIVLAPTLASWLAPGIIESRAGAAIMGKVKVESIDLGWFSDTEVGPVKVIDEQGRTAADVSVKVSRSVWDFVSIALGGARIIDLGTVEVKGTLALIREPDGRTNLEKAVASRSPTTPSTPSGQASSGGGPELVKATLKITELTATIAGLPSSAPGQPPPGEVGVKGLSGEIAAKYTGGSTGGFTASGTIDGAAVGGGSAASARTRIDIDADVLTASMGSGPGMPDSRARVLVAGVPTSLVDALAGLGGALASGIGDTVALTLDASGSMNKAAAKLKLQAQRAGATADFAIDGGVLTSTGPVTAFLESTEFLGAVPALKQSFADAGKSLTLSAAPRVDVAIDGLRMRLPSGADLDLRGSGATVTFKAGALAGRVLAKSPGGPPEGQWREFAAEPMQITLAAADLAAPVSLKAGTRASIDGQPAGELGLDITLDGLLDERGRVKYMVLSEAATTNQASGRPAPDAIGQVLGAFSGLNADVKLTGVNTGLVQPVLAGMHLPIDLREDVGPTLDARLTAQTSGAAPASAAGAGALSQLPPTDATLQIQSQNVQANGAVRLNAGVLTVGAQGITAKVNSSSALVSRLMAGPGADAAPQLITGRGTIDLAVRELSVPFESIATDWARALRLVAEVALTDIAVDAAGFAGGAAAAATGADRAGPVSIERFSLTSRLIPGESPKIDLTSSMQHEGTPFMLTGTLTAPGLPALAQPGATIPKGIDAVVTLAPEGAVEFRGIPQSLAKLSPGLLTGGDAAAGSVEAEVQALLRSLVGPSVDVSVATRPGANPGVQRLDARVVAAGASAEVSAGVRREQVVVSKTQAELRLQPSGVNGLLRALDTEAASGSVSAPMRLREATTITLSMNPMTIPFNQTAAASGSVQPDFARAEGDAVARLAIAPDLVIDNVPVGGGTPAEEGRPASPGKRDSVALRNLKVEARAPLAALDAASSAGKRGRAMIEGILAGGEGAAYANFNADASATLKGEAPEALVNLRNVNSAVVEGLIGKPGLLTGSLGETAQITLRARPTGTAGAAAENIEAEATIESSRLRADTLKVTRTGEAVRLVQPWRATWKPSREFVNTFVMGGGEQARIVDVPQFEIDVRSLGVSVPSGEPGTPSEVGPLKPAHFALDAAVRSGSITLLLPESAAIGEGGGRAARRVTIENVNATVKGVSDAAGAGLDLDTRVGKVTGGGQSVDRPSTLQVRLRGVANAAGVLTTDKARVSADADVQEFPTAFLELFTLQKGRIAHLLGPTVNLDAKLRDITQDPAGARGTILAKATSPKAAAEIAGSVEAGRFVQTGPIEVRLFEGEFELKRDWLGIVPLLTRVEKSRDDKPAVITAQGITAPLGGDMRQLNGTISADMGIARFTTDNFLGRVLKSVGGRQAGAVGKRVEPFVIRIDQGVANYDRFKVPVGEFVIETQGKVDLVQRKIDTVTFIPFSALSDEVIGGSIPNPARPFIDGLTQIPFTTRGPLDSPETKLDFGKAVEEALRRGLQEPGRRIQDGIRDILGPKERP